MTVAFITPFTLDILVISACDQYHPLIEKYLLVNAQCLSTGKANCNLGGKISSRRLRKGILLGGWYDNDFNFANTYTRRDEPETCIGISIFVKLATKDANLGLNCL